MEDTVSNKPHQTRTKIQGSALPEKKKRTTVNEILPKVQEIMMDMHKQGLKPHISQILKQLGRGSAITVKKAVELLNTQHCTSDEKQGTSEVIKVPDDSIDAFKGTIQEIVKRIKLFIDEQKGQNDRLLETIRALMGSDDLQERLRGLESENNLKHDQLIRQREAIIRKDEEIELMQKLIDGMRADNEKLQSLHERTLSELLILKGNDSKCRKNVSKQGKGGEQNEH